MIYYCIQNNTGGIYMKAETKKLIITIINIVIFVGNAIVSFLGNGGDVSTVATVASTVLLTSTLV